MIYRPTLEIVKADLNDVTAISFTTDGWTSINKIFYTITSFCFYQNTKLSSDAFGCSDVREWFYTVHNFIISGKLFTKQLYYLFPTLKQSLGSCNLKIFAMWKQLRHDDGFVTSSVLFLRGSKS
jgi:hypothetical protein